MKKKLMVLNLIFIGLCSILVINDFYYILRDGVISSDGRMSSHAMKFFVMLVIFVIGIIIMNILMFKNKLVLAIILMIIFILVGVTGANSIYDKYNEATSNVDWFSDGIS